MLGIENKKKGSLTDTGTQKLDHLIISWSLFQNHLKLLIFQTQSIRHTNQWLEDRCSDIWVLPSFPAASCPCKGEFAPAYANEVYLGILKVQVGSKWFPLLRVGPKRAPGPAEVEREKKGKRGQWRRVQGGQKKEEMKYRTPRVLYTAGSGCQLLGIYGHGVDWVCPS